MWYQIDFSKVVNLAELHFTAAATFKPGWRPQPNTPPGPPPMIQTFPRSYSVETSLDGQNWEPALPEAKGNNGNNILTLNGTKARFLRLKLTTDPSAEDEGPWSMRQLKVFVQN